MESIDWRAALAHAGNRRTGDSGCRQVVDEERLGLGKYNNRVDDGFGWARVVKGTKAAMNIEDFDARGHQPPEHTDELVV